MIADTACDKFLMLSQHQTISQANSRHKNRLSNLLFKLCSLSYEREIQIVNNNDLVACSKLRIKLGLKPLEVPEPSVEKEGI